MPSAALPNILLMIDLQAGGEGTVESLRRRFPGARFSVVLDSCAPRAVKERFGGDRIIWYNMAMPWRDKVGLLKKIRASRFSHAFFVGANFDLRQLGAVWFAGSPVCRFIRLGPGGGARERNVSIRSLAGAGLVRGWLFLLFLPCFLAVRFVFWCADRRPPAPPASPPPLARLPERPPVSVVIPNYNGRELLAECLPSVVAAASAYGRSTEVIVVDDASTDGSPEFIRDAFPTVILLRLDRNQGFGRACHEGIARASSPLVALLNSDVAVKEDFLLPLVRCFRDPSVFAVQPRAYYPDGRLNVGVNMGRIENGYIRIWNEADTDEEKQVGGLCPTLYCLGGAMLFDRRKYAALGGFDALYYPFRWEDIDLCYQAGKRGWRVLYQPASTVWHRHHATLNKVFHPDYLNVIEMKNEILFIWKNIHEPRLFREHLRRFPAYFLSQILSGRANFPPAFLRALASLPAVLRARRAARRPAAVSDSLALGRSLRVYKNFLRGDAGLGRGRRRQILILNPVFPYPPIDGGKTRVYNLLREAARTNDLHLLCYIEPDQKQYLPEIEKICRTVTTVDFPAPLGNLGKIGEALFPMYYRRFYTPAMQEALSRILAERPLDIVQMEFDKMLVWGRFIRDTPAVYIEHDVASLYLNGGKNPPLPGWGRVIDLLEWMRSLRWEVTEGRRYARIVALSPEDEAVLRPLLPDSSVTSVKHGTNFAQFYAPYREVEEPTLIFIGSFVHYPNVEALGYFRREIWPRIRREVPGARLLVVGSHPTAEVRRFGEEPGVEVAGRVPDVGEWLDRAAVFVAPMRKGFGMKGKVLEAMARGKPVVTTPVGMRGAAVVPGRHLLIGGSPASFAAAAVSLLRDPSLRRRIALAGQELVREEYDWSKAAEQMDRIYEELLGEAG